MRGAGYRRHISVFNLQRGRTSFVEIGKWVAEERLHFAGRDTSGAIRLDCAGARVSRAHGCTGGSEASERVDHAERGALLVKGSGGNDLPRACLVEAERELVIPDHGLQCRSGIVTMGFGANEERAHREMSNDDSGGSENEKKFASLTIHQRHAHDGEQEIAEGEHD